MEDWTAELRADARAHVARRREKLGLPPWDWKDPPKGVLERITEAIMADPINTENQIVCACGCGEKFTPPPARPGTRYKFGHKPKTGKVESIRTAKPPRASKGVSVTDSARDAYLVAQDRAKAELTLIVARIDSFDDQIEAARAQITLLQELKDRAVERHELLSATVAALHGLNTESSQAVAA